MLSQNEKASLLFLGRQFVYFLLLTLCAIGMWKAGKIYHSSLFEESGLVENLEVLLMLITTFVFGIWVFLYPKDRVLSFFLMMLPLTAACRELDAFFDELLPVIGWQFSLFFPLIAVVYVLFHLKDFRGSTVHFVSSPAFYLMMTAMVIIVPIAQCIGHKPFIIDVIGDATYAREIRRLFEESIELEGYLLIFLSSLEYYFSQLRIKKK